MGCGPSSHVTKDQLAIQLAWTTRPITGVDCWHCQFCPGLKRLPTDTVLPAWMAEDDLKAIINICKPFGNCIWCQQDCCGQPACESWIEDGGEPLRLLQSKFPQYLFKFTAVWVLPNCGDLSNWVHLLLIKSGTLPATVVGQPVMSRK